MTAPLEPASTDPGARPRRPDAVSIATELWVVVILGQLIAFIGQYPSLRETWDQQVGALPADTPQEELDLLTSSVTLIVVLGLLALALTVASGAAVLLTRNGYNWARLVVAAMGVFIAVNLMFSLFGDVQPTWVMVPLVISGVAALGGSVLLLRRESEQYCRDMTAHRRRPSGPPNPPQQGPPWGGGNGQQHGPAPWTYGGGQHSGGHQTHPDRPRSNEGNESRGES
ncbi:hypothetical protein VZC37_24210 [Gordonia sp. LSe1-13]|uniref:Transmembrane protein n=1 Tax=Gordonia sesuvii TaxID=3116777 RepID=A0ABU7MKB4_9ACTN|nr:hypothetical protein [Gordonia sp. LSe1-13]